MECERRAADGMDEDEGIGMEAETVGGCAVKIVADNGTAESERMSAVDTKLVGATRFGPKIDEVVVD